MSDNTTNIRRVAITVIRAMLPTDTEDGCDVGSDMYEGLIRDHAEGEHFSEAELSAEVERCLKIIGTGRFNTDL